MKKIIRGLIIACLALNSCWVLAYKAGVDNFTDPAQTITVSKNSPFIVLKLKSNPTTGYRWNLLRYNKKHLLFKGSKYYAPISQLVGASGYEVWRFRVLPAAWGKNLKTVIVMQYKRPWTQQEAGPKTTFNVEIK